MSIYQVKLMPEAQKDLDGFSGKLLLRFEKAIVGLYNNPRPLNSVKLGGSVSKYRVRIGDYRILYEIDDSKKVVKVYRLAHRKEAYR